MNAGAPEMTTRTHEFVLAREQLHWAVFVPLLCVLALACIPALMSWLFVKTLSAMLPAPMASPTQFGFMYLIPLFPVIPIVASLVVLLMTWKRTEYALTNRKLSFRTGWLFTATGELPLENVEAVLVLEPFLGRLFGFGTVTVIGSAGTHFPLRWMPNFREFHFRLKQALEAIRTGREIPPPLTPEVASEPNSPPPSSPHPGERAPSLEAAWQQLNKPAATFPQDDSRYMPKRR